VAGVLSGGWVYLQVSVRRSTPLVRGVRSSAGFARSSLRRRTTERHPPVISLRRRCRSSTSALSSTHTTASTVAEAGRRGKGGPPQSPWGSRVSSSLFAEAPPPRGSPTPPPGGPLSRALFPRVRVTDPQGRRR